MNIAGHDIGVCSWSLRPKDTAELVSAVRQLGLNHVQLALGPLLFLDDKRKYLELGRLRDAGIVVTAGMIEFEGEDYASIAMIRKTGGLMPDEQWPLRRRVVIAAARFAGELGLKRLSFHVGFVPPSSHELYPTLLTRVREVADAAGAAGVEILFETGQETAANLLQFLNDIGSRNVNVNFDPANMILYGAGNPIEAIPILGRHIHHVHVKDGTLSDQPGTRWGQEVLFGTGDVDVNGFLAALKDCGYTGPMLIEREAGENRVADVQKAIETLRAAAASGG